MTTSEEVHLGVSVYGRSVTASFDGLCIKLQTTDDDGRACGVSLDPNALVALIRFAETKGFNLERFEELLGAEAKRRSLESDQ